MHSATFWPCILLILTECSIPSRESDTSSPEGLVPRSICFNELLFNPGEGEIAWIEFYNPSGHAQNLTTLRINHRYSTGRKGIPRAFPAEKPWLNPGEYLVLSENTEKVLLGYPWGRRKAFVETPELPGIYKNGGCLLLEDLSGNVLEELVYGPELHHPVLRETRGVSLEKITPVFPSAQPSSWISAASTAGFGTPGMKNSAFLAPGGQNAHFGFYPAEKKPGGISMQYQTDKAGYTGTLEIFDPEGTSVRVLLDQQTLSTSGEIYWDGKGTKHQPLRAGIYGFSFELFHPEGKTLRWTAATLLLPASP
ncbi:MAG: hypothetical protein WC187_09860 [Bacillota bacterium]